MKKLNMILVLALVAVSAMAAFTDIDNAQYYGKVNIPKTHAAIDANFALIEAGTDAPTLASANIYVGNVSNVRAAVAVSGVITMSNAGATAFAGNAINGVTLGATTPSAVTATALTAQQGVTFADTNNVARTFTVSDDYKHVVTPNAIGAVTNAQSLSAVSTYYTISAAGAVTCTVANASAPGQVFNIINVGAEAITFADSGNLKLSGDAVLGADDTLSLYSADGTNWWETAQQDN